MSPIQDFTADPEFIKQLEAAVAAEAAKEKAKTPERREKPKFGVEYSAASFVCGKHEMRNGDGALGDCNRTDQRDEAKIAETLNTTDRKADAHLIADMREREVKETPALQKREISILVDGLGGTSHGEDALATAVVLGISSHELAKLDPDADDVESMLALMKAAEEANEVLYNYKHKDQRTQELRHCGTTFAMTRVVNGPDGRPRVPYVCGGNTRIMHFRRGEDRLVEVSLDDTVAGDAVRKGQNPDFKSRRKIQVGTKETLTSEDYRHVNDADSAAELDEGLKEHFDDRETLAGDNRIIGLTSRSEFHPHAGIIEADPDDIVLLVTDGVHARLNLAELEERLRQGLDADEICLDAKQAKGHDDDTSAVVIRLNKAA